VRARACRCALGVLGGNPIIAMKTLTGVLLKSGCLGVSLTVATGGLSVAASESEMLCLPQFFASAVSVNGRYPVADDAFDRKNYRLAFKAYYQYFFCLAGSETINSRAEDSGGANLLRRALFQAFEARYADAVVNAQAALKRDSQLGEAQFILGDLLFVSGHKHSARVQWRNANENIGYPAPSDFTSNRRYATAAQAMLARHR